MKHLTIFSRKEIKKKVKNFVFSKIGDRAEKFLLIKNWQENIKNKKIYHQKEEELQSQFLHTFFGNILNYNYQNAEKWNLSIETKTNFDATKSDGSLGFFKFENEEIKQDIRVVIELKNAKTILDKKQNRKDFKGTPVEQAFRYAQKVGETCNWIIVSNFIEIRLYQANDMNKYESFDILDLHQEYEFNRFYYFLAYKQLFIDKASSTIEQALAHRLEKEENISKEFYAHYKVLREVFLQHLIDKNKNIPALTLLEHTQTILDRIVFISVTKDFDLVPYNILPKLEEITKEIWEDDDKELWRQLQKLFKAMDNGMSKRLQQFNGGLFKDKPELNNLVIKDYFLSKLFKLFHYDFESDLSINILGHIFEHSISDIEQLKNEINENRFAKLSDNIDELMSKNIAHEISERKKHGIFYTPEYITRYMVEHTLGKFLEDKKLALNFDEIDTNEQLILWKSYKDILSNLTILDPACGSGAFLTQTFDFLLKEWKLLIALLKKINNLLPKNKANKNLRLEIKNLLDDLQEWKIRKLIVVNNIFGVDLSTEGVEITKLGLWLKTANKHDSLAILENNIKCGNSLIEDTKIAGKKAFNWNNEFSEIMKKGGFDIIVGNPPYLSFQNNFFVEKEMQFFKENYQAVFKIYDAFALFIERGIFLLKKDGCLTYIIPSVLLNNTSFCKLRNLIVKKADIERIVLLEDGVFEDAIVPTIILFLKKEKSKENVKIIKKISEDNFILDKIIDKNFIEKFAHKGFNVNFSKENINLLSKVYKNKIFISDVLDIRETIKTGNNSLYIVKNKKDINHFPVLMGKDIEKYKYFSHQFINFDTNKLSRPIKKELFYNEKLFIRRVANEIIACYDNKNHFATHVVYLALNKDKNISLKYLLSLLNSKLFSHLYKIQYPFKGKIFPEIRIGNLRELPIPKLSLEKQKPYIEKANLMIALNSEMQDLTGDFLETLKEEKNISLKIGKKLKNFWNLDFSELKDELQKQKIKFSLGKENKEWRDYFSEISKKVINLENEISKTDKEINQMVYKLYGLNKSEIELIEKSI